MNAPTDLESSFQQGRALLATGYRHLSVALLQADIPLHGMQDFTTHSSNLAWVCQHHPIIHALLFLLTDAEHGGQPFDHFLPLLPDSLAHGELRRVFWYEQPIALSLHPDPLPPTLFFTQQLSALLAWNSERAHPYPLLVVSEEARSHMSMRDPLPLIALTEPLAAIDAPQYAEQQGGSH